MQVTVQIPQPAPPLPPDFPVIVQNGPPEAALMAGVVIVGIIVAGIVLAPLVRAFARRLEGKAIDPGVLAELDQLRERVAELELGQGRMAELEDRLDFSERLLAQSRDAQKLER